MTTVKVFSTQTLEQSTDLYLSRGRLVDLTQSKTIRGYTLEIAPEVVQSSKGLTGDETLEIELAYIMTKEGQRIYSPMFMKDPYHEKMEQFLDKYADCPYCTIKVLTYHPVLLPQPQFPMRVKLERTRDSRLCAHIQTDPNYYGNNVQGKVFFPDKTWTDAAVGEADVSLKFENKTFGFLFGKMVTYEAPTHSEMLDYLWRQVNPSSLRTYARVEDKTLGSFYHCPTCSAIYYVRGEGDDRLIVEGHNLVPDKEIMEQVGEENYRTFEDYLFEDVYGAELTSAKVHEMLKGSDFKRTSMTPGKYLLEGEWSVCKVKNLPPTLDVAVQRGIFNGYGLEGYELYRLDIVTAQLYRLAEFTLEDVLQCIQEYNDFTAAQDEAIRGHTKKGTLRIHNAV